MARYFMVIRLSVFMRRLLGKESSADLAWGAVGVSLDEPVVVVVEAELLKGQLEFIKV